MYFIVAQLPIECVMCAVCASSTISLYLSCIYISSMIVIWCKRYIWLRNTESILMLLYCCHSHSWTIFERAGSPTQTARVALLHTHPSYVSTHNMHTIHTWTQTCSAALSHCSFATHTHEWYIYSYSIHSGLYCRNTQLIRTHADTTPYRTLAPCTTNGRFKVIMPFLLIMFSPPVFREHFQFHRFSLFSSRKSYYVAVLLLL